MDQHISLKNFKIRIIVNNCNFKFTVSDFTLIGQDLYGELEKFTQCFTISSLVGFEPS